MSKKAVTDWRIYERFVAKLMADQAEQDMTVIPNVKLLGTISGIERQIDVLIDCRYGDDGSARVIVDAKRHKRPLDIKQVEEFEGMMRDVQAKRGILVCPNGYTPAALRRAQEAITIQLVPLTALESLDLNAWDPCSWPSCKGHVLWDATPALEIGERLTIFATSKCDECSRFNVWCWSCQEKFALGDEDEYHCGCHGLWFWLTAIEDESRDETEKLRAVYLLLIYGFAQHAVVDRRPLR